MKTRRWKRATTLFKVQKQERVQFYQYMILVENVPGTL